MGGFTYKLSEFCPVNVTSYADGFTHSTEAPVRVRVLPKGTHIEIQEYDRGTWDPLYSTPFAVEVEVVPA